MNDQRRRGGPIIFFTFLGALVLTVVPIPEMLRPFRPEWVTIILIYWCLTLPNRVNVGTGFLMGLTLDVLTGTLMGQYALAMSVVVFIGVTLHKQIRVYPMWQQAVSVFTLVALDQLLVAWAKGMIGEGPESWLYWMPAITTAVLWPVAFFVLRSMHQRFHVTT